MATEDARYRESSQFRLWSFSVSQLADLRAKTNALAKTSITDRLASRSPPDSRANTPQPYDAGTESYTRMQSKLPDFLTPAEELQLVNHYTVEILRAGNFMKLPTSIQATAAVFFRRFYVTNSIMTYPPAEMMKTSLFFGAKAEGTFHNLSSFADKFPNTTKDHILAGEYLLCQGIRFSFDVRHPFRALEGVVMELRRLQDFEDRRIAKAHAQAREILKFSSLVTDVYFHFTPSQIMLAALSLVDEGLFDRFISQTFSPGTGIAELGENTPVAVRTKKAQLAAERMLGVDVRDKLVAKVKGCRDILGAQPPEKFKEYLKKPEPSNIIKPLNKKLRRCHDPDRWDLVALQQTKKEGTTKRPIIKSGPAHGDDTVFSGSIADGRDIKRRKINKELEDPFGPALLP